MIILASKRTLLLEILQVKQQIILLQPNTYNDVPEGNYGYYLPL